MTDHVHRWRIDEPAGGRYSAGRCQECGEERATFQNADAGDIIEPGNYRKFNTRVRKPR